MIDLDGPLERASLAVQLVWNADRALRVAERIADESGSAIDYEPPDEEWIRFANSDGIGMLSIRVALALVTSELTSTVERTKSEVVVVTISDFTEEDLRASAELLKSSVLPYGWGIDLDTEAFSANDLFVESV